MKPIGWAITGAGHFIHDVFAIMTEISEGNKVTSFVSSAAVEVLRIYGLWDRLREISDGAHYSEVFTDHSEGASAIHAGRLAGEIYSILIVAPATANTVAKCCRGIADSLVTNTIAQALKGSVPVFILPTDQMESTITTIPIRVDSKLCVGCHLCPAEQACKEAAFTIREGRGVIDYLRCVGCCACLEACTYGAVKRGERIRVMARKVDLDNVERLRKIEGITVLRNPEELRDALQKHLRSKI